MPELPEVEVVRRGLTPYLHNSTINRVEVRHDRAVRRNQGSFPDQLQGRLIHHISRRGKFLWCVLDQPEALVVHLGMSGQFRVYPWTDKGAPTEVRRHPHLRILCELEQSSGAVLDLHFLDQRTFGGMHTSPLVSGDHGDHIPESVKHIARDPLDPQFDVLEFINTIHNSQSEIKRVLLNQSIISGIGNIYADEALFRSGLHGSVVVSELTEETILQLVAHVTDVMNESLDEGGTSFDSLYVNVNGESGYFSRSLSVYGREGEPCDRCGSDIQRISFMNRSSFFCGKCQPRTPAVAHS